MYLNFLLVFNLELLFILSKKKLFDRDDTIIVLNDTNFNKTIKKIDNLLVLFYATWCAHCHDFIPAYTKAGIKLYKHKPRLNIAKIDCGQNENTKIQYEIKAFPTLKIFKKGVPYRYEGTMSEEGIYKFMIKNSIPSLSKFNTLTEITNFKNTHEVTVIYFGSDVKILKGLEERSVVDPDNFYGYANFSSAYTTYNVKPNTIILFRGYGLDRSEISGKLSDKGIENFLRKYSNDKLMKFNDRTAKLIWTNQEPALFLFRDPDSKNSPFYEKIIKNIAENLFGKLYVVQTGINTPEENQLNSLTKVLPEQIPCVRIYDPKVSVDKYYVMDKEINEKNIMDFVSDFFQGKLKLGDRQQDIIKQKVKGVIESNSRQFDIDVTDNNLNVLCLFYNNTEEKSKKFLDVYDYIFEYITEALFDEEKNKKLSFVKIDINENELHLEERIFSCPTLKFFKFDDKENPITYEGDYNETTIINFIYKNLNVNKTYDINVINEKKTENNKETNEDL